MTHLKNIGHLISISYCFSKTPATFGRNSQKSLELKICLPLAKQNRSQEMDEIFRIPAGVANICLFVKLEKSSMIEAKINTVLSTS